MNRNETSVTTAVQQPERQRQADRVKQVEILGDALVRVVGRADWSSCMR